MDRLGEIKTSADLTEFIYDIVEQKFVETEIINYYPTQEYFVETNTWLNKITTI